MIVKIKEPKEEKKQETKYPCLMVTSEGKIVFMLKESEGVCLVDPQKHHSKYHTESSWGMTSFKPFKGKVTLSND